MVSGTVAWYELQKGFGLIEQADGTHVFLHWSAMELAGKSFSSLEGKQVQFDIEPGVRGPRAKNVHFIH